MSVKQSRWSLWCLFVAVVALALMGAGCGVVATPVKVGELSTVAPVTGTVEQGTEVATATAAPTAAPTAQATEAGSSPEKASAAQGDSYQVGDVVSIKDMTLAVLGWEVASGSEFVKPDPGNQFVVVDVVLVNKGKSSAHVSSLMQMSLKDDTGQKYDVDFSASAAQEGSSPDGEIAAGERVRGGVGFQIPEGAKGLTFVFDADIFGRGKVFVALGDRPVAVEAPAEMAGERAQTTYRVGDSIKIGELTLTVNELSSPTGDEFNKPEAGKKFFVVDLTIENGSSAPANVSSLLQMSLKDGTGQVYDVDLMATTAAGGTTPDGELAAGEKLRGQVGFQIPEGAAGLVFVFDGDVWRGGKVFVQLM